MITYLQTTVSEMALSPRPEYTGTHPIPRLVSVPWLFATHGKIFAMIGKTPPAARNVPAYRLPTLWVVASMMYPTPPTIDKATNIKPRCCVRSAIQHVTTVTIADRK